MEQILLSHKLQLKIIIFAYKEDFYCNLALPPLPNYYPTYDIFFNASFNILCLYISVNQWHRITIIEMNCYIKTTLYSCNDLPTTHFSFHQNLILNPWMCLLPYCRCLRCVFKSQYWNYKRRYVNNEAILTWLRVVEEGLSSASEHNVIVYNAIFMLSQTCRLNA